MTLSLGANRACAATALCCAWLACTPSTAWAGGAEWRAGAFAGLGIAHLDRPDDAPGEVTLLYGSAFMGPTGAVGGRVAVRPVPGLELSLDPSLQLTRLNGYAATSFARRSVDLGAVAVQVPLFVRWAPSPRADTAPWIGAGVGVRIGAWSAIDDSAAIAAPDDRAPDGATTTSAVLVADVGLRYVAAGYEVPIALRASLNPTYPDNTGARLVDFVDFSAPGRYRVEHRWDVMLVAGIDVELRRFSVR